jgi:hypothetical protein
MDVRHVVLVSMTKKTDAADVARVAAALNRQVVNDLTRHWPVSATVHAFDGLEHMPLDSWLLVIRDDIGAKPGITGFHLSSFGLPYALVQFSDSWSLTASHELLEMLVDPTGNLLVTKNAPRGSLTKVQYLVEICDPCQAKEFSYTVNSVLVSDFITPQFYDPVFSPGVRYSFQGQVTAPRTLLPGGYLVFRDPTTGEMFEWTDPDGDPTPLDGTPEAGMALRTWVDARTKHPDLAGVAKDAPELVRANESERESAKARRAVAAQLTEEIEQLVDGAG